MYLAFVERGPGVIQPQPQPFMMPRLQVQQVQQRGFIIGGRKFQSGRRRNSGNRRRESGVDGGGRIGDGGRGRKRGNRRSEVLVSTAEELDREMDDYHKKSNGGSSP